jgi:hypothetical protein
MSVPRGAASADSPTGRIAETVIMKMGGWLTPSVFRRYAIVDNSDMDEAIQRLGQSEKRVVEEEMHREEQQQQEKAQFRHSEDVSGKRVSSGNVN